MSDAGKKDTPRQEGHEIAWNDIEILDTAQDLQERKVKESLYIRMVPGTCLMNRDEGRELSPLWLRTIKKKAMALYKPRPHELRSRVSPDRYLEHAAPLGSRLIHLRRLHQPSGDLRPPSG